jgi:hypothetical protein
MGWVGKAAQIAGVAMQAFGQIKGGTDAKKAADYNAAVAKQEAKYQEKKTEHDLAFQRQEVERIIGKQRVTGGASGTTGSESILFDTLTQAKIDEEMIRYGGAMNVWRAKSQSSLYGQQGGAFATSGYLSGGATILGGLSRLDYRKKTIPTKTTTRPVYYRGR